jgi:hypothetical protein
MSAMERFLLYLDDLDDAFFALAFVRERRGGPLRTLAAVSFIALAGTAMSVAAVHEPTIGLAAVALLSVLLLYRAVTLPGFAVPSRA